MAEIIRPTALIVLDGWGIDGAKPEGDATELAAPPCMKRLRSSYPFAELSAAGEAVGLPDGVIGNSEVGHMNLGAGRVVYQDLTRISKAIREGELFANPALLAAVRGAKERGRVLHLIGMCSDAGVHSHLDHLLALLEMAHREKLERVFVHAITDGRDSDPHGGAGYCAKVEAKAKALGIGHIASVSGRYYAMDRDKRWERTKRGWDAIVLGKAPLTDDPLRAIEASYAAGKTDEFVDPVTVGGQGGKPLAPIEDGDSVIFWNFRADRARQLTRAFTFPDFADFDRERAPKELTYVTLTRYDEKFTCPAAFAPQSLAWILGAVLADRGLRQLRVAETEKYAHVTYFFNGGIELEYPGEARVLVPSAKEVATYDLKPEMRAAEITDEAVARVTKDGRPDFLLLNYANADMVGHSGKLEPTKAAVRHVDAALGRLLEALGQAGYATIVTADHGNAEQMIDPETGQPHTAHTTNPVPAILVDDARTGAKRRLRSGGRLADVAPTVLALMGLPQPALMDGRSLIEEG